MNPEGQTPIDPYCCEVFRLLQLEGEYTVFLVRTETEMSLLKHLKDCSDCKGTLEAYLNGDSNPVFSRLVPFLKEADASSDQIEAKINERIKHLESVFNDALEELKGLQGSLKSIQR